MSSQLEERYIVLKLSKLEDWQIDSIKDAIYNNDCAVAQVDCVVIEKDWPEYDAVVQMLFERINGV